LTTLLIVSSIIVGKLRTMLEKIQIKGYKSIQEMNLKLTPLNVLIGANGVGKSNFISFFKLLRWMLQNPGQLQVFIGKSGGANALLFDGADITPQIQAELSFETEEEKMITFLGCFMQQAILSFLQKKTFVFLVQAIIV
jgi:predicted ATPase